MPKLSVFSASIISIALDNTPPWMRDKEGCVDINKLFTWTTTQGPILPSERDQVIAELKRNSIDPVEIKHLKGKVQ